MSSPLPDCTGSLLATRELLDRIQLGEREAVEALFRRYRPYLERFLHKRLSSQRLAETQDLVQETMSRALARLPFFEYRGVGCFWAFLRQIALNHLREVRRKDSRGPDSVADDVAERTDRAVAPLVRISQKEEFRAFEKALLGLSDRSREAVLLRVELDMPYAVIAAECALPSADAARMVVVRAIKQIVREMSRDGFKP